MSGKEMVISSGLLILIGFVWVLFRQDRRVIRNFDNCYVVITAVLGFVSAGDSYVIAAAVLQAVIIS
jgi:hypothetical protein